MRIYFIPLAAILCFASCKQKRSAATPKPVQPVQPTTPKDTLQTTHNGIDPLHDTTVLVKLTSEVMQAFKKKDFVALAAMIHPDSGVRFSPYAYVDSNSDKIVTADWVRKQAAKKEKILWGSVDPTMEPINTTLDNYIDRFVYDVDFIKPEHFAVNKAIGFGNTANNLAEMYPTCNFTESHFAALGNGNNGMDWRSLRLVFKLKDGKYYLVGVIHDEWTT